MSAACTIKRLIRWLTNDAQNTYMIVVPSNVRTRIHTHGDAEGYVQVRRGVVINTVYLLQGDDARKDLGPAVMRRHVRGDTFVERAHVPHSVWNPSPTESCVLLITYTPPLERMAMCMGDGNWQMIDAHHTA